MPQMKTIHLSATNQPNEEVAKEAPSLMCTYLPPRQAVGIDNNTNIYFIKPDRNLSDLYQQLNTNNIIL